MSDEVIHINYINSAFDFFNRITTRYFLNRQPYNNKYNDILINKIINYLESNLDKKLDLKNMAERLEYNPAYLSNYFSTKMNITISEYLNRLRVNKACEYLKYTNSSIVEISNILGYSSSQHFTRSFKNAMKITPSEYRKNTEMY